MEGARYLADESENIAMLLARPHLPSSECPSTLYYIMHGTMDGASRLGPSSHCQAFRLRSSTCRFEGYHRGNRWGFSNCNTIYGECPHGIPFSKNLEADKFRSLVILFYSRMLSELYAMENVFYPTRVGDLPDLMGDHRIQAWDNDPSPTAKLGQNPTNEWSYYKSFA